MLTIRKMTSDDIPDVHSMVQALADHHGDVATLTQATLTRDALGAHPWITLLVAQRDERLLGYAALTPMVQLQFGVRGMDMHHLFVMASARKTGVGTALISACLTQAAQQNARFVTVGTHPGNRAAQAVYLNAGFEQRPPGGPRFRIVL